MTDTTDIAALRKRLQSAISQHEMMMGCVMGLSRVDPMYQQCLDALNELEAERQRADRYHFVAMSALESQAEISEQLGISEDECDGSPEQIHEKIEMLQTELAALKTDIESYIGISGELATELEELKGEQAPVAYLYMGDAMECKHVELAEDTDEGRAENCVPLFTAPQKPVVLPAGFYADNDDALLIGRDDAIAAIEAAGGIVKGGE